MQIAWLRMDLTNECNEIWIRKTTSEDGVVYMDTIQFPHELEFSHCIPLEHRTVVQAVKDTLYAGPRIKILEPS